MTKKQIIMMSALIATFVTAMLVGIFLYLTKPAESPIAGNAGDYMKGKNEMFEKTWERLGGKDNVTELECAWLVNDPRCEKYKKK